MAEHFLDAETRHLLPVTALRCLEAGLSAAEARAAWRYEVVPAVGLNAWLVAGAWAGWDDDWLAARIGRRRTGGDVRPGLLGWLRCRALGFPLESYWRSIARCLELLGEARSVREREELARDLAALARHYFDFAPQALSPLARQRAPALYPQPFRSLLAPVTAAAEAELADRRVRAALGEGFIA